MHSKHIVCAFAEPASGPGWANAPIWFVTQNENGNLTLECLQPEDQTAEMQTVYKISAAAHSAMTGAVKRAFAKAPITGKLRRRRTF